MTADPLIHAAERAEREAAMYRRAVGQEATGPPTFTPYSDGYDLVTPDDEPPAGVEGWEDGEATVEGILRLVDDETGYPEPVDCGHLVLSAMGGVEYVKDMIIPGRIHIVAAEEGTGKTYGLYELAIRMAAAGGSFAGTWPIEVGGPVVYLSEMHTDDDWRYQQDVLDSLDILRSTVTGRLFLLDLGTAAHGAPVLTDPDWRVWFTSWCRRRGIRLAVFDTGTGATQVDPWGKSIQQVYRDLRVMLAEHPELAVVLLLHLKKPQGAKAGQRRISDVLGEWGRWCDVLILMEADGSERTKVSTHKRLRDHKRIVATRAGGLLIDPIDITDAKAEKKVKPKDQLATIETHQGLTYAELADVWKVTKETVRKWCADLGDAVILMPGPRNQTRVYPRSAQIALGGDRQPPNDRQVSAVGGASGGDMAVTANRQSDPIGEEGPLAWRSTDTASSGLTVEDEYPPGAWDPDDDGELTS